MTKEQLEKLSDFEINCRIAKSLGVYHSELDGKCNAAIKHEGGNVISIVGVVDYCNNWSDIGPLIVSHSITIARHCSLDEWEAYGGGYVANFDHQIESHTGVECVMHKNPLRAAAIVYLLMQEVV